MHKSKVEKKLSPFLRGIAWGILFVFFVNTIIAPTPSLAQSVSLLTLPQSDSLVNLSPLYTPALLNGLKIDPNNPLKLEFYVHPGDVETGVKSVSTNSDLRQESKKLIKYFMASLTTPDEDMWVNLSPYEKNRIVPKDFGQTQMGRDMLAQDYLLKQLSSSLSHPEGELGKAFWSKLHKRAYQIKGITEIPKDALNKVWIVPERAVVYEKEDRVFVGESRLKVMLREDNLTMDVGVGPRAYPIQLGHPQGGAPTEIFRDILLPAIEHEVNNGKNFAQLRQIYHSLILAIWFKKRLKNSLLGRTYVNQSKVKGVDIKDKEAAKKIYDQYLEAFKKGAYNYIKEEYDETLQQVIPKKYFSGGLVLSDVEAATEFNPVSRTPSAVKDRIKKSVAIDVAMVADPSPETSLKKIPQSFAGIRIKYDDWMKVVLQQFRESMLTYFEKNSREMVFLSEVIKDVFLNAYDAVVIRAGTQKIKGFVGKVVFKVSLAKEGLFRIDVEDNGVGILLGDMEAIGNGNFTSKRRLAQMKLPLSGGIGIAFYQLFNKLRRLNCSFRVFLDTKDVNGEARLKVFKDDASSEIKSGKRKTQGTTLTIEFSVPELSGKVDESKEIYDNQWIFDGAMLTTSSTTTPPAVSAELLQKEFVEHDMRIKELINPDDNESLIGLYGGAGLDVSNYLYSTNIRNSYFVDQFYSMLTREDIEQFFSMSSEEMHEYMERNKMDWYKEMKHKNGYSPIQTFRNKERILAALALELESIGVDLTRISAIEKEDSPGIKFYWNYPGSFEKLPYTITFINADLQNPYQSKELMRVLNNGIDIYYQRAGYTLPNLYQKGMSYINLIYEAMREGGYFVTDDISRNIPGFSAQIVDPNYEEYIDWSEFFPSLPDLEIMDVPGASRIKEAIIEKRKREGGEGNLARCRYGWDQIVRHKNGVVALNNANSRPTLQVESSAKRFVQEALGNLQLNSEKSKILNAMDFLSNLREQKALPLMRNILLNHPEKHVRVMTALSLGKMQDEESFDHIKKMFSDEDVGHKNTQALCMAMLTIDYERSWKFLLEEHTFNVSVFNDISKVLVAHVNKKAIPFIRRFMANKGFSHPLTIQLIFSLGNKKIFSAINFVREVSKQFKNSSFESKIVLLTLSDLEDESSMQEVISVFRRNPYEFNELLLRAVRSVENIVLKFPELRKEFFPILNDLFDNRSLNESVRVEIALVLVELCYRELNSETSEVIGNRSFIEDILASLRNDETTQIFQNIVLRGIGNHRFSEWIVALKYLRAIRDRAGLEILVKKIDDQFDKEIVLKPLYQLLAEEAGVQRRDISTLNENPIQAVWVPVNIHPEDNDRRAQLEALVESGALLSFEEGVERFPYWKDHLEGLLNKDVFFAPIRNPSFIAVRGRKFYPASFGRTIIFENTKNSYVLKYSGGQVPYVDGGLALPYHFDRETWMYGGSMSPRANFDFEVNVRREMENAIHIQEAVQKGFKKDQIIKAAHKQFGVDQDLFLEPMLRVRPLFMPVGILGAQRDERLDALTTIESDQEDLVFVSINDGLRLAGVPEENNKPIQMYVYRNNSGVDSRLINLETMDEWVEYFRRQDFDLKEDGEQTFFMNGGKRYEKHEVFNKTIQEMAARFAVFLRVIHDHLKWGGDKDIGDIFTNQNTGPKVVFDYPTVSANGYSDQSLRHQILLATFAISDVGHSMRLNSSDINSAIDVFRSIITGDIVEDTAMVASDMESIVNKSLKVWGKDKAIYSNVGGIDFDSKKLDLKIQKDTAMLGRIAQGNEGELINFYGMYPVILDMTPIVNVTGVLGVN